MFNENTSIQGPKDLFDVRLKILRHTNPLRAKIIIFSILYHPFKFSTRDWLTIKIQDLDHLIRHLYSICPTPESLESCLYKTAKKLNLSEDDLTTASTIFKAMKSLYVTSEPKSITLPSSVDVKDQLDADGSNQDFHKEETQLLDIADPPWEFYGQPMESWQNPNVENLNHSEAQQADDLTHPLFMYDLENAIDAISYDKNPSPPLEHQDIDHNHETPNLSQDPNSQYSAFSSSKSDIESGNSRFNVTISLLRKINLDNDVRRLIDEQAQKVREILIESVRHLEKELDQILIDRSSQEQISIKYPALQQLTDTLSDHLSQVKNVVAAQAKAAIAVSPRTPSSLALPSFISPSLPSPTLPTPAQAIVALLNPVLKPQGIKVLAKKKETCLHIVLEFDRSATSNEYRAAAPQENLAQNPQKLMTFVRTALLDLNLEGIDRIKVYSRQPGHPSPDLIQTIRWSRHTH